MSTYTDLERDAGDLAKLLNEDGDVETRYGGTKPTYIKAINNLAGSFNLVTAFSFSDGFTIETRNQAGIDANGETWVYGGNLPFTVPPGDIPSEPAYTKVTFNSANNVSLNTGSDVQAFSDSFALKIFQSPTDGGLTEIKTRTVNASEVYEVRKSSDDSLATIYSDAAGTAEIAQNGTDNKSDNDGAFEFYIADGDYYVEVDGVKSSFAVAKKIFQKSIIYVSTTINDPSANPPFYDSLSSAMDSIVDNSVSKPYEIQMLSGVHDASGILLKDYVDIVRSPLAGTDVIIEHDFLPSESFKVRDIFKTANTPYDATDTFPIRCKLKGLIVRGENLNYALHMDFNDSPLIDIEVEDCNFQNSDVNTTASTADYAMGVGIYGGQKLTCDRTLFYGRYDAALPVEKQQGSGWIVHNRSAQKEPCSVTFNDCKSLKGFYGGRIVDYGSGQEDIISINGGVLRGELGNLLCFSNGLEGTVPASITVTGNVPVTRVAFEQQINSGGTIYKCEFPVVIEGFSEMYTANEAISSGDLVSLNAYGTRAIKMLSSIRYKYLIGGVAINPAAFGGRVAVQKSGIAAVNFTPASISSNTQISNSATVDGEVQVAVSGDSIFGTTIVSTSFSTGITAGKAWISLGFAGIKP